MPITFKNYRKGNDPIKGLEVDIIADVDEPTIITVGHIERGKDWISRSHGSSPAMDALGIKPSDD